MFAATHIASKLPTITIPKNIFNIPSGINLADPQFNISRGIDVILDAEILFDIISKNQIKIGNIPLLKETRLGLQDRSVSL